MNITFKKFAKYRLALPDSWNDKLHIYELALPEGVVLIGLEGVVAYQRLNGKNKSEKEDKK